MHIYLAAPLFTKAERDFNTALVVLVREAGYEIFFPQDDSPQDDLPDKVFKADLNGLNQAKIVVAVCDGTPVDDGTAWEIGYAYARGKPVIGLRTDSRAVREGEWVNLMIQESLTERVRSVAEVVPMVNKHANRLRVERCDEHDE